MVNVWTLKKGKSKKSGNSLGNLKACSVQTQKMNKDILEYGYCSFQVIIRCNSVIPIYVWLSTCHLSKEIWPKI